VSLEFANLVPHASWLQGFRQQVDSFLKLIDLLQLHILLVSHFDQQIFHASKTGADGPDDGRDNRRDLHANLGILGHRR
jgi:hypothetical protein